jgi:hypothetical protein
VGCGEEERLDPSIGRVEGRIVLVPEDRPAAGARLLLLDPARNAAVGAPAVCNEEGRFRLDEVPPGWYLPLVAYGTRIVYNPPGHPLRVDGGRVTPLEFGIAEYPGLAGAGLPVKGRVVDATSGAPIKGAWVSIGFTDPAFLSAGSLPPWESVTDADGRFVLREVPIIDGPGTRDGLFPVVAASAGYVPAGTGSFLRQEFLPFSGPDGDTLEVTLHLEPGGMGRALSGRVVHGDRGIAGLVVALSFADTATHATGAVDAPPAPMAAAPGPFGAPLLAPRALIPGQATATDGEGRFRFDGLAPGRYRVHAAYLSDDGWVSADIGRPPGPAIRVLEGDAEGVQVAVVPAIALVSPLGGEDMPVGDYRLTWRAVPGIDRYRVLFSRGNSFLLTEGFETPDTTGRIPPAYYQVGDRARWAVQAYDGDRLLASSDALGSFRVAFR